MASPPPMQKPWMRAITGFAAPRIAAKACAVQVLVAGGGGGVVAGLVELGDVGPGGEGFRARAADDDHPHIRVLIKTFHQWRDRRPHFGS